MKISVVIPAHNEEGFVGKAVKSVNRQEFSRDDFEIIVVADNCSDNTALEAKQAGADSVISVKKGCAAGARNAGAKIAKGKLLVFLDADCIMEKNFLKILWNDFKKEKFDFAGINVESEAKNRYQKSYLIERYHFESSKNARKLKDPQFVDENIIISCAFIFRKSFFKKIGGYNESIFYWEDWDITKRSYKAGGKGLWWNPNLRVKHIEPSTWREVWMHGKTKGYAKAIAYKKNPSFNDLIKALIPLTVFIYIPLGIFRTIRDIYSGFSPIDSLFSNFIVIPTKGIAGSIGFINELAKKGGDL
ncbi:glycosyltransferase [Archaeoglobus sp.]